jgi:hypothetical protein
MLLTVTRTIITFALQTVTESYCLPLIDMTHYKDVDLSLANAIAHMCTLLVTMGTLAYLVLVILSVGKSSGRWVLIVPLK